MKLVIAEKPSVAISIAKVIGATKKKDGYYEGNGYRVSWCVGHLIQMANPDAYDEKYAKWNIEDLPIVPKEYKYEVAKATKKQFNILKKLMNDKDVDIVINACDAGREGESIFRLVYNQANKQTLDYAQSLYEKKLITYPRTDSRCLTEDMIVSTVNNILGKNDFDTERIKVVFDSKKVTDHHAIIPTASSMNEDLTLLPESELKVYELVLNKLHASVGYPLIENTTKIVAEFDGFIFTSSGKVIKDEGFSKYLKEYKSKKSDDEATPDVSVGDVLRIENKEIKEKFTQPPKHFTEDTLLKSMEIAGNDALEKGVEVERKGLGTPATRAGIIENLIYKGFVERDKKNLVATHKGISLVTIVSDTFKSAETTAKWEMELSDIAQGKSSKEEFLKDIENEIKEAVLIYAK